MELETNQATPAGRPETRNPKLKTLTSLYQIKHLRIPAIAGLKAHDIRAA